ncbi:MAG: hypothetical protein ACRDZX_11840 [Acidimicrobiales bacterium]
MLKRATWTGLGLVIGLGASKWLEHKARRHLARYLPLGRLPLRAGASAPASAREAANGALGDVRYALEEGRRAMADREDELRRQLGLGGAGRGRVVPLGRARPRYDPRVPGWRGGDADGSRAVGRGRGEAGRTDRRH